MTQTTYESLPTVQVQEGWFDIIKQAAAKSSEQEPFGTLLAVLVTLVILTISPIALWRYFRYLEVKEKQKAEFERIRWGGVSRRPKSGTGVPSREES